MLFCFKNLSITSNLVLEKIWKFIISFKEIGMKYNWIEYFIIIL